MFKEHEFVVLSHDFPEHGLVAGDVGVVVGIWGDGGYEIEIGRVDGTPVAVVTVEENDIRTPAPQEVLHVREGA